MPHKAEFQWVSSSIIRQLFNDGQYYERSLTGEYITYMKRDSHPEPLADEPHCTRSQIVYYYNRKGEPVAIVHQYLRPDGTLGGSGRPDPKCLFTPDRIFKVRAISSESQSHESE
jgi:hypothetical protein